MASDPTSRPTPDPPAASQPTVEPTSPRPERLASCFRSLQLRLPDGAVRKLALYVPPQYDQDPNHRWPVIVFLHGSGERGQDGWRHTNVGLPHVIQDRPSRFPFIVVMPQSDEMWFRGVEAAAVWCDLDWVLRNFRVDLDRLYLTGISMGGFGAWELAVSRPDAFAAIVPVCGAAPTDYIKNIVHVPVWAFHGSSDQNVPVRGSREPIAALRALGAQPKYTEYPGVGHVCWNQAYATEGLWRWMLQQRRPHAPTEIDYTWPGGLSQVWWLAMQSVNNPTKPAHIHARIDDGHVVIESDQTVVIGLISNAPPLAPGSPITVEWNKVPVYQGEFNGSLGLRAQVNP